MLFAVESLQVSAAAPAGASAKGAGTSRQRGEKRPETSAVQIAFVLFVVINLDEMHRARLRIENVDDAQTAPGALVLQRTAGEFHDLIGQFRTRAEALDFHAGAVVLPPRRKMSPLSLLAGFLEEFGKIARAAVVEEKNVRGFELLLSSVEKHVLEFRRA